MDVFKEIVAELITETVSSYFGFTNRRTSENVTFMEMILAAVRKHTLQKKRGC